MPNTKITDLTSLTVQSGDELVVNRAGSDGKVTAGGIQTPWLTDIDANTFDLLFDDATGIRDDSDNEQLIFQKTASAVNHLEIENGATGSDASINAAGDDTNIGIEFNVQGNPTYSHVTRPAFAFRAGNAVQANISLINTNTGASGPNFLLVQDSSSPAVDDFTGGIEFLGRTASTGVLEIYASIYQQIASATSGAQAGRLIFYVDNGGNDFTKQMVLGGVDGGVIVGADDGLTFPGTGNIRGRGVIYLDEQADADPDIAGSGQIWVDTQTPNVLFFTDDAGTDFRVSPGPNQLDQAAGITIDGGGSAITTGVKGYVEIPYAGTIQRVTMLADQSGSAVVDIWKDTYANYPPTDADSITASAVPTISSATKSQDTTLTGWTTSVTAGDILGFNVDSASTITRLHVILTIRRSAS